VHGHAREKEVKIQAEARERDIFTDRQLCFMMGCSQSGTERVAKFMDELVYNQGED